MNTVLDDIHTMSRTSAPSLVQLCIKTAIDNLSHIRDVGDTDINLLEEILNKCTPDQLLQIENASKDRDLSSVTAALWHQFYIQKFGVESASYLVRMKEQLDVPINWRQIYTEKSKECIVMVSTNVTIVNRTATTPGCFKKSFDQIKQVCGTLVDQTKKVFETVVNQIKKLGGIRRRICANVPAFDMFSVVSIILFAAFTSFVVIAFIGALYIFAAFMLLLDIIPAWFVYISFRRS